MTTCHSGASSKLTAGQASGSRKGKNKTSSAKNNASTSNEDASTSSTKFTPYQLALYKVVHAKIEAEKQAAAAAEAEGMWILIPAACLGS